MNKELISVIIPVYNTANFLRKSLDSVVNQSYDNLEIIIVNDASTDNSVEIINEYVAIDSRIKFINNQTNLGVAETRNIGINKASGQYMTFIDSDDFISLDFIEILYISLKENDVNLIIPPRILFDIVSFHFYTNNYYSNASFLDNHSEDKLVTKDYIFDNIIDLNVSLNALFNLKIIKDNNIRFPTNLTFEDNIFIFSFLLYDPNPEILFTNKATYFYIQNNLSSVTRNTNNFSDIIKINKLIKDFFVQHNIYKKYYSSINYYFCNNILSWGLEGRSKSLYRNIEYFKQSSNFLKQEMDDDYINKVLKQKHRTYYNKIKEIKYNYKNFYYKNLLKDVYENNIVRKIISRYFVRYLKIFLKIILNLSIKKIIKIVFILYRIIAKIILVTFRSIYTTYKD